MQKLISTDSVGWLGTPEQFVYLYKDYFKDGTFDGAEMIAFKPFGKLKKFINILEKNKIPTLSFHGKTGGENRLPPKYGIIMTIVNSFIFSAETLINNFNSIDFLSHTPYLENDFIKKTIIDCRPKTLWIENHNYGEQGIEEAKNQILDYRKKGVDARGMLDLYHFLAKVPISKMIEDWLKIIKKIEGYFEWFSGVHFPIGSRTDDSLPIEKMTDEMLSLFGKKIVPFLKRIVIENQQAGSGLVISTKKMLDKQKIRNKINFYRLKKAGML